MKMIGGALSDAERKQNQRQRQREKMGEEEYKKIRCEFIELEKKNNNNHK